MLSLLLTTVTTSVYAIKATGTCPKEIMGGAHMGMDHMGHDMSQMSMDLPVAKLAEDECVNCHGVHGISHSKDVPNLAGQNALYLCEWLVACHEEGGQCESHEDIAGKLTEEDVLGLSNYFAAMPTFSK